MNARDQERPGTLREYGVNHIDTAAGYGDSELRIAPWLARQPGHFFLATKTGRRDYAGAREEIRRSLDRLGVDRVDLLQLHNLVRRDRMGNSAATGGRARGGG
jgi:aryl-alcohol dehydrogenase-like predicted oxidoreductase